MYGNLMHSSDGVTRAAGVTSRMQVTGILPCSWINILLILEKQACLFFPLT